MSALQACPSDRVLQVCAAYGLPAHTGSRTDTRHELASRRAAEMRARLWPGMIALLTGPSGSGKTAAVRALRTALGSRAIDAQALLRALLHRPGTVIDALDAPFDSTLRALSLAGLAEPMVWVRPPAALSEGEQARLAIAASLLRAARTPRAWVLIDECCSVLDSITARNVAHTLRRWSTRTGAIVVCASAREQLEGWLSPDRVWRCSL